MQLRSPLAVASTTALLRYVLESAGLLGGLAVAVSGVGCGGKVVVDDGSGGGSTSTGTGTGTTTTSETACTPVATVYSVLEECIAAPGACPAKDSAEAAAQLIAQMNLESCSGSSDLAAVLCGPIDTGGMCCYQVDGQVFLCGGRPFVVDGAARVAELSARADWMAREATPAADLDPEARRILGDRWARAGLDEHASIASFARFALDLLAVGAPADLLRATQQALGDEVRHAELCFALASAYAGQPVGPGPLSVGGAAHDRVDLAEIAAAAAREGCVGETLAAYEAARARDAATDPAVRAALDELARDEAEHAALAYRFVAWSLRQGDDKVRAAVERAFADGLAPGLAPAPDAARDLRAHGYLSLADRHALGLRCKAEVVAPASRALLEQTIAAYAPT
jgi:hypothetical protein